MKPWKLEISSGLEKVLLRVPQKERHRFISALNNILENPGREQLFKVSEEIWRLRVGEWRIFLCLNLKNRSISAHY